MAQFNLKVFNLNTLPYNLSGDEILLKIQFYKSQNPSYKKGLQITIYSDIPDNYILYNYTTAETNNFGVLNAKIPTDQILDKNIETAVVWAEINFDGKTYTSNRAIVNFINDKVIVLEYTIIDANDIYHRTNEANNYDIIDANDPINRVTNSGDYTIYDRG